MKISKDLIREIKYAYATSKSTASEIAKQFNMNERTVKSYCCGVKKIFNTPDFNTGMLLECLIGGVFYESKYTKEEIQNAVDKYHGVFDKNYYGLKSRI